MHIFCQTGGEQNTQSDELISDIHICFASFPDQIFEGDTFQCLFSTAGGLSAVFDTSSSLKIFLIVPTLTVDLNLVGSD